jgi:hypothetical protein
MLVSRLRILVYEFTHLIRSRGGADTVCDTFPVELNLVAHLAVQTVSAVTTFFLAMCTHPQAQVAAQAELDATVGNERLLTIADRPSLPYINAIMSEVLRWVLLCQVVNTALFRHLRSLIQVPLHAGFLQRAMLENEYEGYRILAGSLIIPTSGD